jgi:predicted RNase H-like HicB family nuclease
MKYVYTAVFSPCEGQFSVSFPDLPGCLTCGDTLLEALEMAQDASEMWLAHYEDHGLKIPESTNKWNPAEYPAGSFTNLVYADTLQYRKANDTKAVKRTVSLPKWMDERVSEEGLSLSRVLQDALSQRLN